MIQKKSDDAVSPVLGVMLMVVVTVVIGAVIAGFATGMVADTEPTPNAVLKVEILSNSLALESGNQNYAGPDFQITHISGDAVDTDNIEIHLSWTHSGCSHSSTYSAEKFQKLWQSGMTTSTAGVAGTRYQPMYLKSMMDVERNNYHSHGMDHYFGDVTLTPGLKITASTDFIGGVVGKYNNADSPYAMSPYMDVIFNNGETIDEGNGIMDHLPVGTAVDVMIVHLPSDKAIYDKKVVVQ